jgi:hypothetical protein
VCESGPTRRRDLRATELDGERGETRAIRNGTGEHATDAVSSGQELANQEEAEKATAKLERGAQKHHWTKEHRPLERTRMNDLSKGLLKNEGESGKPGPPPRRGRLHGSLTEAGDDSAYQCGCDEYEA